MAYGQAGSKHAMFSGAPAITPIQSVGIGFPAAVRRQQFLLFRAGGAVGVSLVIVVIQTDVGRGFFILLVIISYGNIICQFFIIIIVVLFVKRLKIA